jgi:hypothetical protein
MTGAGDPSMKDLWWQASPSRLERPFLNADLVNVFSSSVPDGLVTIAGSEGAAAIARFMAGGGTTFRFTPTSPLGARAARSADFLAVIPATKAQLEAQLTAQAATGRLDVSAVWLASPPRPNWPIAHVATEPQLAGIIGGTHGVEIWIDAFTHDLTARTYSVAIRFIVCDNFGVDEHDLYSPALFAFWVLQHERVGPRAYVHEVEIPAGFTGTF